MLLLENVQKTFNAGTVNEKKALTGVNLNMNSKDFVTVIGGNGAGKSTMLNMIAGVYSIDKGKVVLNGRDLTREPEYKRAKYISRVFQDPMMGTAANMEIQENLALAYRRGKKRGLAWGITKDEKELFYEKLKVLGLGLEERMTSKVGLLSGGQRQRIALARGLIRKVCYMVLDEGTSALDEENALDIEQNLMNRKELCVIVITHNLRDSIRKQLTRVYEI